MDYRNLYLFYKLKYHQLKKSSLIGGMDPKPNPWGKVPAKPSSAESPFASLSAERDARLARMREIEEQTRIKKEQERIEKEARRLEAERIQKEAEEQMKAQQLAEEIRLEQARIKREKDWESLTLPPELIYKMMEVGNIDLNILISAIKKPELKNTIKTFIIQNIMDKNITIKELYKIYKNSYHIRDEIDEIIMFILNDGKFNPDDLYFIFNNFSAKKFNGIVYDIVCSMEVKTLTAHDLVLLYKIINKKSLLELINNKITERNISVSDLLTLYSLDEFKELLNPLINDTYDSKFKSIRKMYDSTLFEYIKIIHIIIYFLCERMIVLDKQPKSYKLEVVFGGFSSITGNEFKNTFVYSRNIDNTIIETKIEKNETINVGKYNFNNLLNGIMNQINYQTERRVSLKNISIKDSNNKIIFNFEL